MKNKKYFLIVLFLFFANIVMAQKITVRGVVSYSEDNSPLIGATIVVKGTSTITITDVDGKYEVSCNKNDTLVFSYVQCKTQEINVDGRSEINVSLSDDINLIEEVVVLGYGTAKKISSVVGSASTVKNKVFKNVPVASTADVLQGQVAGLQVITSSGEPSATASMRLRGVSSINAVTEPLYILDGTPVSAAVFTSIAPGDIDKVTVLKDASSTAIYGSRAANGVIYITTKKGVTETPTIKVSTQYGVSYMANNRVKLLNSEQYFKVREMVDPSLIENQQFQDLKNFRLKNKIGINWRDWILNEGAPTVSADLSISGRTQSTDYYISLGMHDQEGILPNSFMSRYNLRSNINTKLKSWLKVGVNLGLSYEKSRTNAYANGGANSYNPMNIADWSLPYTVPYEILLDENGNFKGYGKELDLFEDNANRWNYFYLTKLQPRKRNHIRLNGNMYQEFNPLKGLVIRTVQAIEAFDYRIKSKILDDKYHLFTSSASESFQRYYSLTSTNTAEYKFDIFDKHHFIVLGGHESIVNNSESFDAGSSQMLDNFANDVDQGTIFSKPAYSLSEEAYNSIFARLSYEFNDRYFIDLSFRRDGSSLFGANRKYANFYSVGGMWNLKTEDYFKNLKWLDKLQIRSSYGTTGNSGISPYLANGVISTGKVYNGDGSLVVSSVDNPALTWETVVALNLALSARLFNILDLEIDFYKKHTKDMLLKIPFSYSTGFTEGWGNAANMMNKGIDVQFNLDAYNKNDFIINISGTFNYNKNEITKLFGEREEFVISGTSLKYQVGKPLGEIYQVRYVGVDPANGKQLWLDKDGNITSEYSNSNKVFTGKQSYAPFTAGMNLDFYWKGISLSAAFSGIFGKWMINNSRFFLEKSDFISDSNGAVSLLDMWTTPGQRTSIPKAGETIYLDTRFMENASFVRLKNLQLSYSFPQKWIDKTKMFNSVKVYAVGRNLLTFTRYNGYDPEVDGSNQLGNYPNSKQYSFGIELTF